MKTKLPKTFDSCIHHLHSSFPHMWFKPGEEFSPEYAGCIWTGEGSRVYEPQTDQLVEVFDYYCTLSPVYYLFDKYCHRKSIGIEWIDPGTVMLWPDNF